MHTNLACFSCNRYDECRYDYNYYDYNYNYYDYYDYSADWRMHMGSA